MLKPDLTMWHSGLYLDRPLVAKAIEAAGQDPRRMGQALALIRSEARRSMRYVKRPTTNAPPGQPPRARLPQRPNLRSIEYFWSPAIGMGVVGSAIFPGTRARLQYVPEVFCRPYPAAVLNAFAGTMAGLVEELPRCKMGEPG